MSLLTARQLDVAMGYRDGLNSKEIAAKLNVAPKTIQVHTMALYKRLGVHTSAGMVGRMYETGQFVAGERYPVAPDSPAVSALEQIVAIIRPWIEKRG